MALQTARLGTIKTLASYDVRFLARNSRLIVDEIEYLSVGLNGGDLFFELITAV